MLGRTALTTSGAAMHWTSSCLVRGWFWLCRVSVFWVGDAGAPLWQILAAGEWRSPAFMEYLDKFQLETDVVVQAHVGESDDEDNV